MAQVSPSSLPRPWQSPRVGAPGPGVYSPGLPPNPGRVDSEGAHGMWRKRVGHHLKGRKRNHQVAKSDIPAGAWESHSQKHFLPTLGPQATRIKLLTLQPTLCSPLRVAPPTASGPARIPELGLPLTIPFPHIPPAKQWRVLPTLPPHPSLTICSSPLPWHQPGPPPSLTYRTLPPPAP